MIYYFSGTGNSKWVAETLAEKLKTSAVNLIDCKAPQPLPEDEILGIVFPVYAWDAPQIVYDFIKKLPTHNGFTFAIATCGDEAGNTISKLSKALRLDSSYSLSMPSNYMIGMRLDAPDDANRKLIAAANQLVEISDSLSMHQHLHQVRTGSFARLKTAVVGSLFNHFGRTTKPFTVNNDCTKCGLCAEVCPSKTIVLIDGKPTWSGTCYQCLACLNKCPVEAIDYGKTTKGKGRYYFKGIPK